MEDSSNSDADSVLSNQSAKEDEYRHKCKQCSDWFEADLMVACYDCCCDPQQYLCHICESQQYDSLEELRRQSNWWLVRDTYLGRIQCCSEECAGRAGFDAEGDIRVNCEDTESYEGSDMSDADKKFELLF